MSSLFALKDPALSGSRKQVTSKLSARHHQQMQQKNPSTIISIGSQEQHNSSIHSARKNNVNQGTSISPRNFGGSGSDDGFPASNTEESEENQDLVLPTMGYLDGNPAEK